MARRAKNAPGTDGPPGIVSGLTSGCDWIPKEYREGAEILSGNLWKPADGESRLLVITGFKTKDSSLTEADKDTGEVRQYNLYSAVDLKTREPFLFVGGALFDYQMNAGDIKTGDRLGMKFKGMKKIPNSTFSGKDWEIIKLQGQGVPGEK
jgi:hypothetical protein